MALFHYVETITNDAGDILVGYFVKLKDSDTGAYATLYSDRNLTPISAASGLADTGKSDENGRVSIYVEDGTYDIEVYDKEDSGLLLDTITAFPMFGFDSAADALAATEARDEAEGFRDEAQTFRNTALTYRDETEGFKNDAEAASQAALAAGKIYPDTASGVAANPNDGDDWWLDSGDTLDYYTTQSGAAQDEGFSLTGKAVLDAAIAGVQSAIPLDPILTTLPLPRGSLVNENIISGTSNCIVNADGDIEFTGSGTFIYEHLLSEDEIAERDAGRDLFVYFAKVSGTPSDIPDVQQRNSGGAIDSRTDATLNAASTYYIYQFTPDPAVDRLRFRFGAGAGVIVGRPFILKVNEALADTTLASYDDLETDWAEEVAESYGDIYAAHTLNNTVGDLGEIYADNRTIFSPVGSTNQLQIPVHGAVQAGDYFTLVLEVVDASGFDINQVSIAPNDGNNNFGTEQIDVYRYGDLYILQGKGDAASAADAFYFTLSLNNRTGSSRGLLTNADATLRVHYMFGGKVEPKKVVAVEKVKRALAAKAKRTATVIPDAAQFGNDAFATVKAAYVAGYGKIVEQGANTAQIEYALANGIAFNRDLILSGSEENGARPLLTQALTLNPGDWTATAADANVYYYATTTDPVRIWETGNTGADYDFEGTYAFGRMGVPDPATGKPKAAANEAAVQANIGAYWYGNGSQGTGIYIRPFGDTLTGKTHKIPAENGMSERLLLSVTFANVTLENLELAYAGDHLIKEYAGAKVTRSNCLIHSSGNNAVVFDVSGASYIPGDLPNAHYDAGNDLVGWNSSPGVRTIMDLGDDKFNNSISDGVAGHGNQGTAVVILSGNAQCNNNGKQGLVMVTPIDIVGNGSLECIGNVDVDFLLRYGTATTASTIDNFHLTCGTMEISQNDPTLCTGEMTVTVTNRDKINGQVAVDLAANVDINLVDAVGGPGIVFYRRSSGSGSLQHEGAGTIRNFNIAYDLDGGTTTIRGTRPQFCDNGIVQVGGGAIDLSVDDPIVFTNVTTEFDGSVSAPDQAKTFTLTAS